MAKVEITENKKLGENLFYIQSSLSEMFNHADCMVKTTVLGDRAKLIINCPEYYFDIINAEISDKIAEVITISYKYDMFNKQLKLGGLSKEEREILLVSLIAADLEEDKKFCFEKLKGNTNVAIDGMVNFRLKPLIKKWQEIIEYMPTCFFPSQLKQFIEYLIENRKRRVYIDNGKIFDGHYRRLKKHTLINYDKLNVIREVILSNCGEIEINGSIPQTDEVYLKEYYGDRIIFSTGYFN